MGWDHPRVGIMVMGNFIAFNCQVCIYRSRASSGGERSDHGSIQEKFFQPRFVQVPEDLTVEEGRFCRIDFKVITIPSCCSTQLKLQEFSFLLP